MRRLKTLRRSDYVPQGEIRIEFLTSVSLDRDKEEEEEEDNVVSLMTLHSSKGLEFDGVYIVGFEEGFMPHIRNADSESGSGVDIRKRDDWCMWD